MIKQVNVKEQISDEIQKSMMDSDILFKKPSFS